MRDAERNAAGRLPRCGAWLALAAGALRRTVGAPGAPPSDRVLYAAAWRAPGRVGSVAIRGKSPSRDTGPIRGFLMVFPRTSVIIQHAGHPPVRGGSRRAVILYNRGQEYTRRALSERGDECEWFALLPRAHRRRRARARSGRLTTDLDRPYTWTHGRRLDPATYLLQRRVAEHLARCLAPRPALRRGGDDAPARAVRTSPGDGARSPPQGSDGGRSSRDRRGVPRACSAGDSGSGSSLVEIRGAGGGVAVFTSRGSSGRDIRASRSRRTCTSSGSARRLERVMDREDLSRIAPRSRLRDAQSLHGVLPPRVRRDAVVAPPRARGRPAVAPRAGEQRS